MNGNFCRRCFKAYVDKTANDNQLLLGTVLRQCNGCYTLQRCVMSYFKYGEHKTNDDSTRIISSEYVKRVEND